ncbi:MAG: hypothetical protein COV75_04810 [Candidatus Omnitrophica bacterium CG11_big_fil_rev_8_21_14_0_20_63_9]|nr:MAG: hypothetical protein COV75_04810 [Candidatus Omnitrophica bacterium CG11_big_fil_rev_8_21_14_0_20_63_9]
MPGPIRIRIVTNEGEAVADEAVSVRAPGELGYLGILYNHAPLVTTLKPGKFTWRRPSGEERLVFVGEGLLEVNRNQVTVLTETVTQQALEGSA